ncbi:hypothetical protein OC834_003966 [Tilletia horrida]|nr:hypothetical protein OC834_003966 [Tilletia horrida]
MAQDLARLQFHIQAVRHTSAQGVAVRRQTEQTASQLLATTVKDINRILDDAQHRMDADVTHLRTELDRHIGAARTEATLRVESIARMVAEALCEPSTASMAAGAVQGLEGSANDLYRHAAAVEAEYLGRLPRIGPSSTAASDEMHHFPPERGSTAPPQYSSTETGEHITSRQGPRLRHEALDSETGEIVDATDSSDAGEDQDL